MSDNHENDDSQPGVPGDYEVGYGKPPVHSRFKPKVSGNPRGRRKGSRGLRYHLDRELDAKLTIRANGRIVKGTPLELAMRTLAMRAATGDLRANKQLVDLSLSLFGPGDRGGEEERLSAQDQVLLDRALGRVIMDDAPPPTDGAGSGADEAAAREGDDG